MTVILNYEKNQVLRARKMFVHGRSGAHRSKDCHPETENRLRVYVRQFVKEFCNTLRGIKYYVLNTVESSENSRYSKI